MIRAALLAAALAVSMAQQRPDAQGEPDIKFPGGKSQRDEILKMEFEKSQHDAARLVKLSGELQADLEKTDYRVLSVSLVKKAEDIEKLARQIKTRLRR
jgi:hypothetical protein